MSCLDADINFTFNEKLYKGFWIYSSVLIFMSLYYIIINLKHIDVIQRLNPSFFEKIDEYNGCVRNTPDDDSVPTLTVSIWYILYLIFYITIYILLLIYVYVNYNNIHQTLGQTFKIFGILFIIMFIIYHMIYFYDRCFKSINEDDSCYIPPCSEGKVWSFDELLCVEMPKPEDENEDKCCANNEDDEEECKKFEDEFKDEELKERCNNNELCFYSENGICDGDDTTPTPTPDPSASLTPTPTPTQTTNGNSIENITDQEQCRLYRDDEETCNTKSECLWCPNLVSQKCIDRSSDMTGTDETICNQEFNKFPEIPKFRIENIVATFLSPNKKEGFALLENYDEIYSDKYNLKSNFKDTGEFSYKADKLMANLESFLKNIDN